MRILHTSDWHLGAELVQRPRRAEHALFLDWLLRTIREEQIEALLVAGDVFDSFAPSNASNKLYNDFLARLAQDGVCRGIVIVGGNHDSPSYLDAPASVLGFLGIHVLGCAGREERLAEEVVLLSDRDGRPGAVVCAVPYLRERDVRTPEPGEDADTRDEALRKGVRDHYRKVAEIAGAAAGEAGDVPVLAMGHLFASGSAVGDGERAVHVGTLADMDGSFLGASFAYTALGHIHTPQRVGGSDTVRYSGSPIPMNIGETERTKQVLVVDVPSRAGLPVKVREIPVPVFRRLVRIVGDRDGLLAQMREMAAKAPRKTDWERGDRKEASRDSEGNWTLGEAWVEAVLTSPASDSILQDLNDAAREATPEGCAAPVVLRTSLARRTTGPEGAGAGETACETLSDLTPMEVFERLLDEEERDGEAREDLRRLFLELVAGLDVSEEDASEERPSGQDAVDAAAGEAR